MSEIDLLKKNKANIRKKFGVKQIGVFGSIARGTAKRGSDIDVLVEFERTVDFFEFIDLKEYLENMFERNVDLVTKKALKPLIKNKILDQVIYV
ncbi:MAG: nucleotidyltransferase family protein [Nitrospirae bacterium]|nr:nucleotidyltransferase family protein [Nitrospirota bacterium]